VGWIDGESASPSLSMRDDMVEVDPREMSVRDVSSLKQALSMFVQQGVACLPVLDGEDHFVGEVRLADVLES
jgi:CBS domain-containing protein